VHPRPIYVPGVTDVVQVATGQYFTCVRHGDDTISCWGDNVEGQLGDGTTRNDRPAVAQVAGISDAIFLDAGYNMTCVIHRGGSVSCWGWNVDGQLGVGSSGSAYFPTPVTLPTPVVDIDTKGYGHTCALATDGRVFCWGANDYGHLGTEMSPTNVPTVPVLDIADAMAIDTAREASCAIRMGGQVMCWGRNPNNRFSDTGMDLHMRPVATTAFPLASAISMSTSMTCVTPSAGGSPVCVGDDSRPGDGSGGSATPVEVLAPSSDFDELVVEGGSGSGTLACGVRRGDRALFCWGLNALGQVGDGTLTTRMAPTPVLPPAP
jgi:alpha-tubulin suppressor-like RCC1 family protein